MSKATVKDMFPNIRNHIDPDREVGIEVEVEGTGVQFPNDIGWWNQTGDGSLRGESAEYVLKGPCRRVKVRHRLQHLDIAFSRYKSKVVPSERTGVHIHINAQDMSFWQVTTYCCLYLALEKLLVRYCGSDREGNMFCLRAVDAEYLPYVLSQCVSNEAFVGLSNDLRYASINLNSLPKYGSVEFRALRTPKKMIDIHDWVKMLLAVKDASYGFAHPREIIEKVSEIGPAAFLKLVLGSHAAKLIYPGWEDDMWESIYLVQDIAYTPKKKKIKEETSERRPPARRLR